MTNVFNCFSLLQYFRNIYFTCLKNSFLKKLKFWIRESLQVRTFEFESPKKGRVFESESRLGPAPKPDPRIHAQGPCADWRKALRHPCADWRGLAPPLRHQI